MVSFSLSVPLSFPSFPLRMLFTASAYLSTLVSPSLSFFPTSNPLYSFRLFIGSLLPPFSAFLSFALAASRRAMWPGLGNGEARSSRRLQSPPPLRRLQCSDAWYIFLHRAGQSCFSGSCLHCLG